ncbi:NAD dependent epimerase/dehydratase, partial [Athelia psychrophila]
ILVTGATGVQGGTTARELLGKNIPVRAFVRDPAAPAALALQKLGAELAQGDFDDVPAITAAVAGVSGVFLNTYPSFTDPAAEVRYAQNFVTAARAAQTVTTFVVSTVYKAGERAALAAAKPAYPFLAFYFSRKAGVEDVVRGGGFENTTVLRPDWLHYNYLAPGCAIHFPEYRSEHVLAVSYARDYKLAHFDPEDVGKFAAAAFVEPRRFQGTIELSGEALTFDEIAAIISRVAGVEVTARFRTEEETKTLIEGGTLPVLAGQVWAGEVSFERESLEKYGIELGTLERYLEREK